MSAIIQQTYNLIRQTRTYQFLGILAAAIFLGFLCVPGATDGYAIFDMGGVRGVYNSAWLGGMAACLPVILLWLPGFYLLRSQVSEDRRLKIGQIIAATPMSKFRYIASKFLGNFVVLMALDLLFTAAIVAMQLIRGEVMQISLPQYLIPLLYLTIPHLLVLAALTVLFDVTPGLKGASGNILIFCIWVTFSTISVAVPGGATDLFGLGFILNQMLGSAQARYPGLPSTTSFGYYKIDGATPTFDWGGIVWDQGFLATRLIWIGIAIVLVIVTAFLFDRFCGAGKPRKEIHFGKQKAVVHTKGMGRVGVLSPVKRTSGSNLPGHIRGELKIALAGQSVWWYLAVLTCIVLSVFTAPGDGEKWIALIMLLPMAVWSQMGCRERLDRTGDLIASSCDLPVKWTATWISGVITSLLMSSGMMLRFLLHGNRAGLLAWIVGAMFLPTLALVLGSGCGNRKVFEGICIALFYLGPINGMPGFDFLGLTEKNTLLYLVLTAVLLLIGYGVQVMKEKRVLKYA